MLGLEEEHRHLTAGDGRRRAIVPAAAATGDLVVEEIFDEEVERVRGRHVREALADVERPGPGEGRGAGAQRLVEGRVPVGGRTRAGDAHPIAVVGRRGGVAVGRGTRADAAVVGEAVVERVDGAGGTAERGRDPGEGHGAGEKVLPARLDDGALTELEDSVQVGQGARAVDVHADRPARVGDWFAAPDRVARVGGRRQGQDGIRRGRRRGARDRSGHRVKGEVAVAVRNEDDERAVGRERGEHVVDGRIVRQEDDVASVPIHLFDLPRRAARIDALGHVDQQRAVGRPRRTAVLLEKIASRGAGDSRGQDLFARAIGIEGHNFILGRQRTVGHHLRPDSGKCDLRPVGRPGRVDLVVVRVGEVRLAASVDVDDEDVELRRDHLTGGHPRES